VTRWLLALALAGAAVAGAQPAAQTRAAPKVLYTSFPTAETGFDPARITDLYSRTITPHIFEGLYGYDHLARPPKIVPLTADGFPEVSKDFRVWTVRIKPGIHFADDPVFKGAKRELVAADYVYAFKRFADPANKSAVWSYLEEFDIEGLKAQRELALKSG
jgi:ABC-type transport system substrate-binding protein